MVYLFNGLIDIPVTDLLVILLTVIVIYLIILEFEFRQLRKIVRRFDEEEIQLGVEMRELRKSVGELKTVIEGTGRKIKK
jgi:hypothetical protein